MANARLLGLAVALAVITACDRPPVQTGKSTSAGAPRAHVTFEKKRLCMELGRRLYESDYKDVPPGTNGVPPEYAYNPRLDTCVLYMSFFSQNHESRLIIDTLTNRELASHIPEPVNEFETRAPIQLSTADTTAPVGSMIVTARS